MIVFVTGDLLAAQESYIAQGVAEGNQEGLGTGLALKISKKWPNVQAAFKKYARTGRFIGGHIWTLEPDGNQPGFIYLATQPNMYHATSLFTESSSRACEMGRQKPGRIHRLAKNRVWAWQIILARRGETPAYGAATTWAYAVRRL
ncbi:hypothetical protein NKK48_12640 [Mesorhizobium sp. C386A]|uniref:hypothetical protein n=1 Tax=Mesorhizobium sp. LNJC386A00 TaxID=1287270 RepID=UPI001FD9D9B1|nr:MULTISPECIES: hypothetical protein [unclassified Mesorhizobium]